MAKHSGIDCTDHQGIAFEFSMSQTDPLVNLQCLADSPPDPMGLAALQQPLERRKYDEYVDQQLLLQAVASEVLDTQWHCRFFGRSAARPEATAGSVRWEADGFQLARSQRIQHLYQTISDRVMELYHEGLLLDEIANLLNVDRNTITSSVAYWQKSRNLPVPDGRTRRKSLARKSR